MTSLTKPLTRTMTDEHGKPIVVTLTADGILFRRPRHRDSYLLPYGAGETRAQVMAAGIGFTSSKQRKGSTKVNRGLLHLSKDEV